MKKLLLCFCLGLLTAACAKDEPVQMTGAPAAPKSAQKNAAPETCGFTYAENLRACQPYSCREKTADGATVTRTIKGLEDGKCTETTVTQAKADAAPDNGGAANANPAPAEQTCTFNEEQRAQMADYLAQYFSGGASPAVQPGESPLNAFLHQGVCSGPGPNGAEQFSAVTCTGTESITVVTLGEDGQEILETVQCQP